VIAQTPDIYHQPTDGIQPLGPGEVLRFGPGVPVPAASGPDHVAAVWHGVARPAEPDRRPHRLRRWILPFLVLVAVLALLAWFRLGKPLAVTGATVHTSAVPVSCSGTATVTGTLQTNGAAGTVTYRWKRSDGTVSNDLQQQVAKGTNTVDVVLLWSFNGPGTVQATATLDVLSPSPVTAATTFSYVCK
jgi:hypothetical protein